MAAMAQYVCEGEVEFHTICEILKVSCQCDAYHLDLCNLQTEAEHEVLTLIFLEKLVCCKFYTTHM